MSESTEPAPATEAVAIEPQEDGSLLVRLQEGVRLGLIVVLTTTTQEESECPCGDPEPHPVINEVVSSWRDPNMNSGLAAVLLTRTAEEIGNEDPAATLSALVKLYPERVDRIVEILDHAAREQLGDLAGQLTDEERRALGMLSGPAPHPSMPLEDVLAPYQRDLEADYRELTPDEVASWPISNPLDLTPGWKPDPADPGRWERWWNGDAWFTRVRPTTALDAEQYRAALAQWERHVATDGFQGEPDA